MKEEKAAKEKARKEALEAERQAKIDAGEMDPFSA